MENENVIIGGAQFGDRAETVFFYLGIAAPANKDVMSVLLKRNNIDPMQVKQVLCSAIECSGMNPDTHGRLVGFAYMQDNGKILIVSTDSSLNIYLEEFGKEAIVYYEKGGERRTAPETEQPYRRQVC